MWSSIALQLFTPHIAPPSSPPSAAARRLSATCCRFSARFGGQSPWDKAKERPKFAEEYRSFGDYDDDPMFGVSPAAKQRVWWSDDDDESSWNADYYNDGDDDDLFGSFGVFEEGSIVFNWLSKLLRAFLWMLPAVTISMLLGTGPNNFIMALALPLAQTALSLVIDTFQEGPDDFPDARPRSRTKRRPSGAPATNYKVRAEEKYAQSDKKVGDYQSWVTADNVSGKTGATSTQSFGGWDELDSQVTKDELLKRTPFQNANGQRKHKRNKQRKRPRKRASPLLIQLLIDYFPFFGFWTNLM